MRGYYALIGGGSPLLRLTTAQAEALAAELRRRGHGTIRVEIAMRYTEPGAAAAVGEDSGCGREAGDRAPALSAGVRRDDDIEPRAIWSGRGTACAGSGDSLDRLLSSSSRLSGCDEREDPGGAGSSASSHSRRSGSSLQRARRAGELSETGRPVRLADPRDGGSPAGISSGRIGSIASPSRAGRVRSAGSDPSTDSVIEELPGRSAVVVVPVSFVSDHIETLYEIDILFAGLARRAGIRHFVRCGALNDSPLFTNAMADLVEPLLGER